MWLQNTLNDCWNVILNWFENLKDLITNNWLLSLIIICASFVFSLIVCVTIITLLPHDYFLESRQIHPIKNHVLRFFVAILKNLIGLVLIIVGILLSLPGVPGQGLLTILVGLIISDFPGKKRLVRRIISIRVVNLGANEIRKRFNRPRFVLDEE